MDDLPKDKFPGKLKQLRTINDSSGAELVKKRFKESCSIILEEWRSRSDAERGKSNDEQKKTKAKKTADDSANEFLRKNVYRLGNLLLDEEQIEAVRSLFPSEPKRRIDVPALEENIFHWILVYMFPSSQGKMLLSVRNRMAKQLVYARRHKIPAYLLVGFLYQVKNSNNLKEEIECNAYEYWYARLVPGAETLAKIKEKSQSV